MLRQQPPEVHKWHTAASISAQQSVHHPVQLSTVNIPPSSIILHIGFEGGGCSAIYICRAQLGKWEYLVYTRTVLPEMRQHVTLEAIYIWPRWSCQTWLPCAGDLPTQQAHAADAETGHGWGFTLRLSLHHAMEVGIIKLLQAAVSTQQQQHRNRLGSNQNCA
jgi:hypothetical protein